MPHNPFMQEAINLSIQKMEANEGGPFGAVIVRNGEIVGRGWNRVTSTNDPTAHAEVVAIRNACDALGSYDLSDCEIYTSCEPCPMCLSAIYWARLRHIYFGNSRHDAADIGFDDAFIYDEIPQDPRLRQIPSTELMGEQAAEAFKRWQEKEDKLRY